MKNSPDFGGSIPAGVLEEAAGWFANLSDAAAGDAEHRRWQIWLDAHPDNARAWQRVEEVTGRFGPLAGSGRTTRDVLASPRAAARRRMLKVLGLLVFAGSGGLAATRLPWRAWREDLALNRAAYRTSVGETQALQLEDSTKIWLAARSALDITYTSSLRRLSLYQGELLIETAHDPVSPARPFVVETFHGRLRALGTRFAVRTRVLDTRADVFDGAVELTPDGNGTAGMILRAGQQGTFDRVGIRSVGVADAGREAWSRGILLADRMRLDELVEELARWHPQAIACAPEVCALKVVGTYPLKELDRILDALATSLPVRISRGEQGVRIVAAPRATR